MRAWENENDNGHFWWGKLAIVQHCASQSEQSLFFKSSLKKLSKTFWNTRYYLGAAFICQEFNNKWPQLTRKCTILSHCVHQWSVVSNLGNLRKMETLNFWVQAICYAHCKIRPLLVHSWPNQNFFFVLVPFNQLSTVWSKLTILIHLAFEPSLPLLSFSSYGKWPRKQVFHEVAWLIEALCVNYSNLKFNDDDYSSQAFNGKWCDTLLFSELSRLLLRSSACEACFWGKRLMMKRIQRRNWCISSSESGMGFFTTRTPSQIEQKRLFFSCPCLRE